MAFLVGTDIGTTSTKTTVFDERGVIVSSAAKEYMYDTPRQGYAEQDPEEWWSAAAGTIREALDKAGIDAADIAAVGLSGQMHGMVALDANRRVVRKAVLHCDVRSGAVVSELLEKMAVRSFYDITYNPLFPGFQLVSLEWMRKSEPDNYEKTRTVICPKDYVRFKMTGEIGVEATDASGTLVYDITKQEWSAHILERLDIDPALFPAPIRSPCDLAGRIVPEAAAATGLKVGTPVVYGGGDQPMHCLGNGVFEKNVMMATIGTSGQVVTVSDRPVKNPAMNTQMFRYVNKDAWLGLAGFLHAGVTYRWFHRTFAEDISLQQMDDLARAVPPCAAGLVFFPAMAGERTPYIDSDTRGIFLGMTMSHTKAHFIRSVMEGVAFELKSGVDILSGLFGDPVKFICAGGGAKSAVWVQIQADIFDQEVRVSKVKEQACLGAAIAAGVGAGLFSDIREGFAAMSGSDAHAVEPIKANARKYAEFYSEVFSGLYPRNKELLHKTWKY